MIERLRPMLPVVLRTWGRLLVALIGSQLFLSVVGVGDAAGFAVMPAVFLALFQPSGSTRTRLAVVAVGTVLAAGLAVLGGLVAGTTWPLILGLGLCGLVLGFAPRVGPHAAALQLPLLTTFVYSAANAGVAAGERGIAVLLALPVLLLATALFTPPDGRRPLLLGAARGLAGLAPALGAIAVGDPAGALAERALDSFRTAAAKVKSLPLENTSRARALLLLSRSMPAAVSATLLLERTARPADRAWAATASAQSAALAAAFAGKAEPPAPLTVPPEGPARELGTALEGVRGALLTLRGGPAPDPDTGWAPSRWERMRAGMTMADPVTRSALRLALACLLTGAASVLFGIGKVYWSVFAAVMVLATPTALVRARMRDRLLGTVGGVLLAGVLVPLTDGARGLQLALGLLVLLPGLLMMAVDYGWTCFFVATAVGLLYGGLGEQGDFFHFRLLENAVGCAVIVLVMGLTWRGDPWPAAASRLLRGIADALRSSDPGSHRNELRRRILVLRDAAAERAAAPGEMAPVWTFGSAAGHLAALAADGVPMDPGGFDLLADRLFAPGPMPAPTGPAALELDRLTTAVRALTPIPPNP